MKKLITIAVIAAALVSGQADNTDCLKNDLATSFGGATAWFGPSKPWFEREKPHVKWTPKEGQAVNTYLVHYGIMKDDPSTPDIDETGQRKNLDAPVWKTGVTEGFETYRVWLRCGPSGASIGYDLSPYSKVVLGLYIYKLGTNTNPIGKAEAITSVGN